jgi:hypothetical protein
MSQLEDDYEYSCPYCGTALSLRVDHTAGSRQQFVIDCENCCRPIEVELDVESDGYVNLIAKREGEG